MANKKILKASSYYLEDVLGLDLDKRAEEGKLSFLLLNQPPVCDYHCRRCFMPDYRRKNYDPKKALALEEYKKILADAKQNGILCLEISGEGEPLLEKKLPSIIEYADKLGIMTTLITNGNTITEEQIKFFKKHNVTLVFSLHTLDKKKYELDNCNEGSFDRKIQNIEKAAVIYKGTKIIKKGFEVYRLAIHATLQKDNVEEIGKLKEFCHGHEIFFSIAPLALIGSALKHKEIQFSDGEKIIEDIVWQGDNSIIHSHSSSKAFGREVCGTAYYGLNIGWDGYILFDAHYGYEIGERNMLGNIRDIPFREAIEKQRKYSKILFENIVGSCPPRDIRGKQFLEKVLKGKIKISV
jgi:MoaA/NifB/PqqE/SkfB family radical SAM enzyme